MTFQLNTELFPTCPHCGSENLASNDHVFARCDIESFQVSEDGSVHTEYASTGSEVYWDSQEPANPAQPYVCGGCDRTMGLLELLPGLKHPTALTRKQRDGLVEELVAEFTGRRLSARELQELATHGFTPFAKRSDEELRDAYSDTFGDSELEQLLFELGAEDTDGTPPAPANAGAG